MKNKLLTAALLASMALFPAPGGADPGPPGDVPGGWRKYYVELSFGNTILFLDQSITEKTGIRRETLPVPSFLFLSQWRISRHFATAAVWNLPYGTVKRIDAASVSEKFVAPSYGAGATWIVSTFNILDKASIEPEFALLILRTYKSTSSRGDYFFPAGVFRLNISRITGLNLYLGITQAPAKDTTAFLYGIGQRF